MLSMNAYFRPQLGIQIFVVPTWVIVCISIFTSFVQWLSVLVITHLALRVSSRMALLHDGVECDHQKSIECRLLGNWRIELCLCASEPTTERPMQAARVVGRVTPGVWHARAGNVLERASLVSRGTFCMQSRVAGCGRGRLRGADCGGTVAVRQLAFITMVMITVLPGSANFGHLA